MHFPDGDRKVRRNLLDLDVTHFFADGLDDWVWPRRIEIPAQAIPADKPFGLLFGQVGRESFIGVPELEQGRIAGTSIFGAGLRSLCPPAQAVGDTIDTVSKAMINACQATEIRDGNLMVATPLLFCRQHITDANIFRRRAGMASCPVFRLAK
jgi:hypothetical protein